MLRGDHQVPLAEVLVLQQIDEWNLRAHKEYALQYFHEVLKKGDKDKISTVDRLSYIMRVGQGRVTEMETLWEEAQLWEKNLKEAVPGIGNPGDQTCGLDDTVFSILGPHNTPGYGEIQLIFSREIMHHPNSYFLPCAGTYFNRGKQQSFRGLGQDGPWINREWIPRQVGRGNRLPDEEVRRNFMQSMWHCSVPRWDVTIAKELVARTQQWKVRTLKESLSFSQITWEHILEFNEACEGHAWLEAHLPREVPLEFVTDVVMPKKGCLDRLEQMGWSTSKIRERLGPDTTLTVTGSSEASNVAAKKMACADKPVMHTGFSFITQETKTNNIFNPPAGIMLSNPRETQWFRFKASTSSPFNIMLTSNVVHLCRGRVNPLEQSGINADQVLLVKFPQHDAVTFEAQQLGTERKAASTFPFQGFNSDDTREKPNYVDYLFELRASAQQLQVQHLGFSELFVQNKEIASVCFEIPFTFEGTVYVGCSAELLGCPVSIVDLQCLSERPRIGQQVLQAIRKQPLAQLQYIVEVDGIPDPLPLCTEAAALNLPVEMCPLMKISEDHGKRYRHLCKWGLSCTFLQEGAEGRGVEWSEHHQRFCHKDLMVCGRGTSCKKLKDPAHRIRFHHEGVHDWIMACMDPQCTSRNEWYHGVNYSHDPTLFTELEEALLSQAWQSRQ